MQINVESLRKAFNAVREKMSENCDYLVSLDARNGDGDLGLSMRDGWTAAADSLNGCDADLGIALLGAAKAFNKAAPSTLGTIMSFWFMGAAKALKGNSEVTLDDFAAAMGKGIEQIEAKAGSKPGEKTVLDALDPAVRAIAENASDVNVLKLAADAAKAGAESTKDMMPKHGRAAYYGEKGVGLVDGGAVAAALIFEAISEL